MKVMRFSIFVDDGPNAGRELLAHLNSRILDDIFGANIVSVATDNRSRPTAIRKFINAIFGWLDGFNPALERRCLDIIRVEKIQIVYIEGSNYGRLAKAIGTNFPHCKVVTFFHNVESRFFWGALKVKPTLKSLGVLLAYWVAERWAVRYSQRIICLNMRDSLLLQRIYGRGATDIHPICLEGEPPDLKNVNAKPEGLFVGGAFYANVEGVRWFAREVAPSLSCRITIVGKGFEKYSAELEAYLNISVVGTVDTVDRWYERATFVIAPIFDGSGMKTKVGEAMMHGKPVIGTPEAFIGYEPIIESAGILCNDAKSFIAAINATCSGDRTFDANELQDLFRTHYSSTSKRLRYEETFRLLAVQDKS